MIDTNSSEDKYDVSKDLPVERSDASLRRVAIVILLAGICAAVVFLVLVFKGAMSQPNGGGDDGLSPYIASASRKESLSSQTAVAVASPVEVSNGTAGSFATISSNGVQIIKKSSNVALSSAQSSYMEQYKERVSAAVGRSGENGDQEIVADYKITEKESGKKIHFYIDYARTSFTPDYAVIVSPSNVEYQATYLNDKKNGEIYFVIDKPEVGTWRAYFASGKYGAFVCSFLTQEQYEVVSRPLTEDEIVSRTTN